MNLRPLFKFLLLKKFDENRAIIFENKIIIL